MFNCIGNFISPARCFFTDLDFEDNLLSINKSLEEYRACANLPEKKLKLEQIYSQAIFCLKHSGKGHTPDKQLGFLMAEILLQYGRLSDKENFPLSKQLFLAALNLHLYSMGLLKSCLDMREFPSLSDLKKTENSPDLFASLEEWICTTNIEHCLSAAFTDSFAQNNSQRHLLNFAQITFSLWRCYQHIARYKEKNPQNDSRFTHLYGLCEGLLLLLDNEESRYELAQFYVEARPFMYLRQYPTDLEGICALYTKALTYDSSKVMQARVANSQFEILFGSDKKSEALPFIKKAAELSVELSSDPLLCANIHHHYAEYFMQPEVFDLPQAEIHLQKVAIIMETYRIEGNEPLDFAVYYLQIAYLQLFLGRAKDSKASLEKALAILERQPDSSPQLLIRAQKLIQLFQKALKAKSATELLAEFQRARFQNP